VLASIAYAAPRLREAVTLVHLGCSGAVVDDIIRHGEIGLPGGGDDPSTEPQLARLDTLLNRPGPGAPQRTPDRILLSVGGNDSGFVGVIATIVLPAKGYWVPIVGPIAIGVGAKAVCPYRDSGPLLTPLCTFRESAQQRLEERLPGAYHDLAAALARPGWGDVYQFTYPNPIVGGGGAPCQLRSLRKPQHLTDMSGFEALMGYLPWFVRGFPYSWDFELRYDPEPIQGPRIISTIDCDWATEPDDSETCQALWVHARLNQLVSANASGRWHVVSRHADAIFGHGICERNTSFELALPRALGGQWVERWTPRSLHPYEAANPRWFRTPNDSIVTQYGDAKHFHHGTFHPTYQAHLAYAQAALDEAFGP